MRALLLLVLLAPGAAGWSVTIEPPALAEEGLPFALRLCASAPGRAQVRVLAENATLDAREDRYLPAFDRASCRDLEARSAHGIVRVEARLRSEGGSRIEARAYANVSVETAPGALRIVEARATPLEGVTILNVGDEPAPLARRTLAGQALPDALVAPGARIFVGERAPPDVDHVPLALRVRAGTMALRVGDRVESTLDVPRLKPGEGTLGRYGLTNESARPFDAAGAWVVYATPDAGTAPIVALLDAARVEVLVEAYTLTSPDVAAALGRALDRGARVRMLLEGAPVGGVPHEERAIVAALAARGAEVHALGGEGARYRTLHAKLVVVDREAASVSTENLHESASRGYGIVARNATLAQAIARVIEADLAGHDVAPFATRGPPATLAPLVQLPPRAPFAWDGSAPVALVLSPDDPGALARAIAGARDRVSAQVLRAEPDGPMVDALLAAARAGARVRVALDARFDDGTNAATIARLHEAAAREGLAIDARLADPARTLHAKAFVVDGRIAYVGSMNWVRPAWERNREAGLLIEADAIARWLEKEMEGTEQGPEKGARATPAPGAWLALALACFSRGRACGPCRARGGA